jgi:CubicO group peptidase (beta-lactamase class C family)
MFKVFAWPYLFIRLMAGLLVGLAGLNTAVADQRLANAIDELEQIDRLHTLIIAHQGDIIFESTWNGPGPITPVNIKSLSKTILATLVGQAIAKGVIPSLQSTLGELTPELIPPQADPRVHNITIEQLLSMQTGLAGTSGANYGRWVQSRDWVYSALSQPVLHAPGTERIYSTGNSHVLSAMLTELTGRSTWDLAQQWLTQPLNVMLPPWPQDPQGYYFGGNDMMLSPRALIRFGELYRQKGLLNGQPILSSQWIDQAWQPRGTSEWTGDGYGLGWFVTDWQGLTAYYGRGYGGQLLWVIPEQELTIVVTASSNPPSPGYPFVLALIDILQQQLLPVLLDDSNLQVSSQANPSMLQ